MTQIFILGTLITLVTIAMVSNVIAKGEVTLWGVFKTIIAVIVFAAMIAVVVPFTILGVVWGLIRTGFIYGDNCTLGKVATWMLDILEELKQDLASVKPEETSEKGEET